MFREQEHNFNIFNLNNKRKAKNQMKKKRNDASTRKWNFKNFILFENWELWMCAIRFAYPKKSEEDTASKQKNKAKWSKKAGEPATAREI